MFFRFITLSFLCLFSLIGSAQSVFNEYSSLFTVPANYTIRYTDSPPIIDGHINDVVWGSVSWTDYFQDIEGDIRPKPYHETRVKMLWDNSNLYIAAELQDPHVWATLTKRDEIVFFDNDFEVFIDPLNSAHNYFEIEVNALNTIFDLFLYKPYRNGGSALFSWDSQGMQHAVQIQGTINNTNDEDTGWTVEMAIPFRALTMGNEVNVPKEGSLWRINFSRVQWETEIIDGKYIKRKDAKGKVLPENNWVWSPQGVIDMHRPERWGYLLFTKNGVNDQSQFELPYSEKQKQYLWLVYYKQQDYRHKNKRFAKSLGELGLSDLNIDIDGKMNELILITTDHRFNIMIKDELGKFVSLNEEGLVTN
ncbi:MAG: carbohydrate-binding family 9-like protein [Dysgonomonas sp.]